MNLTNEILLFNHFLIMSDFCVLLYYLNFVFYCTHVRMSYVLNSYLLTYSMAVIVRYFSEIGSFRGALRKSG